MSEPYEQGKPNIDSSENDDVVHMPENQRAFRWMEWGRRKTRYIGYLTSEMKPRESEDLLYIDYEELGEDFC